VGDTLALTPHMGWNSWYIWVDKVSDKIMRDAADAMVSSGMIDHGYTYVNIDDCWMASGGQPRDAQGNIRSKKNFPDMKALADYIHGRGLKAGIYISPGPRTCGGCEGSYGHEAQDARQFAAWGFDFLKYDWCSYTKIAGKLPNRDAMKKPYQLMGDLLKKQDRDMVFNICYGRGNVWEWGREVGGHSWRTAGDLGGSFSGISAKLFRDTFDLYARGDLHKFGGPGGWNDPDYLLLGYLRNWGGPQTAPTPLSPNEQYTHVTLWCLLAAPLIFSGDMTRLDDFTLGLLTNDEVIEVDQDPLGRPGRRVAQKGGLEVWAKDMEDGSKAVGLFNRSQVEAPVTARWSDLGIQGEQLVRDSWRQQDLGRFADHFTSPVAPHGTRLLRLRSAGDKAPARAAP
jgi:alpha-galactosidase